MTPEEKIQQLLADGLQRDVDAGLVPDSFVETLAAQLAAPNPYADFFEPKYTRPTRWQMWRWHAKSYLRHLGLALIDRCDREGYDW